MVEIVFKKKTFFSTYFMHYENDNLNTKKLHLLCHLFSPIRANFLTLSRKRVIFCERKSKNLQLHATMSRWLPDNTKNAQSSSTFFSSYNFCLQHHFASSKINAPHPKHFHTPKKHANLHIQPPRHPDTPNKVVHTYKFSLIIYVPQGKYWPGQCPSFLLVERPTAISRAAGSHWWNGGRYSAALHLLHL